MPHAENEEEEEEGFQNIFETIQARDIFNLELAIPVSILNE